MDSTIQKWRESQPQFSIQHEAFGSTKQFHSPCGKRLRQRGFKNLIWKFFIVLSLAVQNAFVIRGSPFEVAGNKRLVRIKSIRIVNLLIVDLHFNIGKNWRRNVIDMINERNWSLPLLLLRLFLIQFCFSFLFFFLCFGIVCFATTTLDKFQFQSQVRVSNQYGGSDSCEI